MEKKTCVRCGEEFKTRNNSNLCYSCTLYDLTGGCAPEEGDFNTAKIQSGTMTDEELRFLQRDLRSVELGTSPEGFSSLSSLDDGYEDEWEDEYEEDTIIDWEEICQTCGYSLSECACYDEAYLIYAICPKEWHTWNTYVYQYALEAVKENMIKSHEKECDCGQELTFHIDTVSSEN